jgi:hypothetical protein
LCSGVLGFPPLSLGDGMQEQHRPGWDVRIGGGGAFPPVRPVLGSVRGLNTGLLEELPNECAALGAVVIEGLGRVTM